MAKKPLAPLIPLEKLKEALSALIAVPKERVDKAEAERPKRARSPKPR